MKKYKYLNMIIILIAIPFLLNTMEDPGLEKDKEFPLISVDELLVDANRCGELNPYSLEAAIVFYNNVDEYSWCTSGGEGAQSCSLIGACSVSCWPGYYACCSLALGCHCVEDSSDPGET